MYQAQAPIMSENEVASDTLPRTLAYVTCEALVKSMNLPTDSPLLAEITQHYGFDMCHPRSTYPLRVYFRLVKLFREQLFADLSDEDAFFEIGRRSALYFITHTILGRVSFSASKNTDPKRFLDAFLRGYNPLFSRGTRSVEHVEPGFSRLTMIDDPSDPHYAKGMLYAVLHSGGATDIRIEPQPVAKHHVVYNIYWRDKA